MGHRFARIGAGALLALLVPAAVLGADTKLPDLRPTVRSVKPAGGLRGENVDILVKGRDLDHTRQIYFSHPGIVAEIASSDFYQVHAKVDIGRDVPVGVYDYRLVTARGSYVGLFNVGALPQVKDTEPNNEVAKAQGVTLPVTIDGQIDSNDYDLYRFHAKAGETVAIDLLAARIGAQLDAKLAVLDERGHEVAFCEDFYSTGDPFIAFTPERDGDYIAQVSDAFERGSDFAVYRLSIGVLPYLYAAAPTAATAGRTGEIELRGVNLDKVTEIVLGDSIARGEIVSRTADRLTVRFVVPPGKTGPTVIRVSSEAGPPPVPLPFLISGLEERRSTGAHMRQKPELVQPGVAITGVLDGKRAAHFFAVDVQAADTLVFQVDSSALGYPLDPTVTIYDDIGRQMAFQDDVAEFGAQQPPAFDPQLIQTFPAAGRYLVKVRDAAERGDPRFLYRLSITRADPDFELAALTASQTLYKNRRNKATVRVRRHGGWDAPIEVWIENPPPGVSAAKHVAPPKNSVYRNCCAEDQVVDGTDVDLQLTVTGEAAAEAFPMRVHARGTFAGKTIEHTLDVLYRSDTDLGRANVGEWLASVTGLPPIVLTVPENSSVEAGKTAKLEVNAQRFDEATEPIAIEMKPAVDGVTLRNTLLAPGAGRIEIQMQVAAGATPGNYPVVLMAGGVSSPPIDLKITAPAPEEKK